jgi:hypothetical protein
MKTKFTITEEEKNKILSKYGILNESVNETCDSGDCVNGTGKKTTITDVSGKKLTEVYSGTFKNGKYLKGELITTINDTTNTFRGSFKDNYLEGSGTYIREVKNKYKSSFVGEFSEGSLTKGTAYYIFYTDSEGAIIIVDSDNVTGAGSIFNDATIKFEDGTVYRGTLVDEGGKLQFNDSKGYWTHDLVGDHFKKFGSTKNPDTESTKTEMSSSNSGSGEMPVITDEMRKKWKGCIGTTDLSIFYFDGINGSKDYGYLPEMPELGMAKFEGVVDGKNIKVHACFDKFKLISTRGEGETGERGDFDGLYETGNEKSDTFEGTEEIANKFRFGLLKNSKDYKFHDDEWEYDGGFENGIIDNTNSTYKYSTIKFNDLSTYSGGFVNGKIEGKGEFRFADGGIYSGNFEQYTNEQGNETYKVTLSNGVVIEDLIEYHKSLGKTPLNSKTTDNTVGIVKGATIEGQTFFKTDISYKFEDGSLFEKTLEGLLPNTLIRLKTKTSLEMEDKPIKEYFETTADDKGFFKIESIPYGTYVFEATMGNPDNPNFTYVNKNLLINSNKKYRITLNKTRLGKKIEKDGFKYAELSNFDFEESFSTSEDYLDAFLKTMVKDQELSDTFISDLLSGVFQKKYGKRTALKRCVESFNTYVEQIKLAYNEKINSKFLKSKEEVDETKKILQYCWSTYKEDIKKKINKKELSLIQQPGGGNLMKYQVYLKESTEDVNIYGNMGDLSKTIRNVIKEHNMKKTADRRIEKQIIENRLRFVLKNQSIYNSNNLIKSSLNEEKNNLIFTGYNFDLVNKSFDDIIKTLI